MKRIIIYNVIDFMEKMISDLVKNNNPKSFKLAVELARIKYELMLKV